jgi:hypothetical protein
MAAKAWHPAVQAAAELDRSSATWRHLMDRLVALQRSIEARAAPDRDESFIDRLCITKVGNRAHLDFYGDPYGESFSDLLAALVDASVANCVASVDLRGPDEGANGTRNWDLTAIAESGVSFPELRRLCVEQTKPADHNRTIVARDYDEDGVLAKILAKAPALEVLVTPSAPNADFFQVGQCAIQYLSVDTGYDHQGFIANLARSSCFPKLRSFEFGECNETYMEDFSAHLTPFADYRDLFSSLAFAPVKVFQWRNPVCSPKEMAEIRSLKKDCQILVVRWSAEWIR